MRNFLIVTGIFQIIAGWLTFSTGISQDDFWTGATSQAWYAANMDYHDAVWRLAWWQIGTGFCVGVMGIIMLIVGLNINGASGND